MRPLLIRLLPVLLAAAAVTGCSQPAVAPSQATSAPQPTASEATVEPAQAPQTTATTSSAATDAPTATAAPTETPVPTATPDPLAGAPKGQAALDLLLAASKAQLAQPAFRMTMTGKDDNGKDTAVVLEYVKPDKFHMVTAEAEFIIVNEGTFMKDAGGVWQKSPVNMQDLVAELLNEQSIEKLIKDLKYEDIKLAGADVVGGKPAWVYQYKSSVDVGGTQVATESKTWIGVNDKLPYRVEAQSDAGAGAKSTMTGVYEYDESIRIEAPQ